MENVNLTDSLHLKSNPTLERIFMLLEEGDFWRADNLCSQLLDQLPRCAEAYVGKLMAEIQICRPEEFFTTNTPFTTSLNYQHAISYSIDPLRNFLMFAPYENFYLRGIKQMNSACTEAEFLQAGEIFKSISSYKDSSEKIRQCILSAEINRKNAVYDRAVSNVNLDQISSLQSAIADFESIPRWKDADQQVISCKNRLHQLETERKRNIKNIKTISIIICVLVLGFYLIKNFAIPPIKTHLQYNQAIALMNNKDYQSAISAFESLNGYKDSLARIEACNIAIKDQKYEEAISLYQNRKYTAAIAAFELLTGYKDSSSLLELCQTAIKDQKYEEAISLYQNGKYTAAITTFESLKGYKDSSVQINLCQTAIKDQKYDAALELYNDGNYEDAITEFQALNGYKDSNTQIEACKTAIKDQEYDVAIAFYSAGDYLSAYPALISLDGYKDSNQKANEIFLQYKTAVLRNSKIGDNVILGSYEQDNNSSNGKEDIEWIVLEKKGTSFLLISKDILDCKPFNNEDVDITWDKSYLRTWLNHSFFENTFSITERNLIQNSNISPDKNPEYNTNSGIATVDKVFLLSINEVNSYLNQDRKIPKHANPSNYAKKKGIVISHYGYSSWWLRTSGGHQDRAATVDEFGRVSNSGHFVDWGDSLDIGCSGVRPVIWINLNSGDF